MLLYKKILTKLIHNNISISTAESCTGGLLAYGFTRNKGSSYVFQGGYITYSNQSKINDLNVKKTTLSKYGSVSKEIALEMVNGLYKKKKTNICISTTGIAGPNGGTFKKPIGLVFIGICFQGKTKIMKKNFTGTRFQIQKKCVNFVFQYLDSLI